MKGLIDIAGRFQSRRRSFSSKVLSSQLQTPGGAPNYCRSSCSSCKQLVAAVVVGFQMVEFMQRRAAAIYLQLEYQFWSDELLEIFWLLLLLLSSVGNSCFLACLFLAFLASWSLHSEDPTFVFLLSSWILSAFVSCKNSHKSTCVFSRPVFLKKKKQKQNKTVLKFWSSAEWQLPPMQQQQRPSGLETSSSGKALGSRPQTIGACPKVQSRRSCRCLLLCSRVTNSWRSLRWKVSKNSLSLSLSLSLTHTHTHSNSWDGR